jgi:phenylacetate-CoA ligase
MADDLDRRVRELVAHAYEHAPAVRQWLENAGLTADAIQSAADLTKIPILSKDALVEIHRQHPPFGGFLTIDPAELPRIYISPGPIYDPQPPPDDPEAAIEPFRYVGFTGGDRVLNTFMYHLTPAGLLVDEGLRACGATVIPSGPGNTELQIMLATALGTTGFVGQPSYLMTVLDKMEEMGIEPGAVPFRKALFSAEPYTPTQRARFEGTYGMKTTSAYGTADLGLLGYTRHGVEGFCLLRHVYVQIADPTTGEDVAPGDTGEIVVTTFSRSYPLIRFGTGDLGALAPESACDGQQLTGLFGRSGDAIKVRGMFLHPNQLLGAAARFPQIEKLQAVITRPQNNDFVTLKVALREGASEGGIADELQALARAAVRLRIDEVVFVPAAEIEGRTIMDARDWS